MRYLKEQEITAFLRAAREYHNTNGLEPRPLVIATLMLATGMRISEVVGEDYEYHIDKHGRRVSPVPTEQQIKDNQFRSVKNTIPGLYIEDMDCEHQICTVYKGKRNKGRVIPMLPEHFAAMEAYLANTGRTWKSLGKVFDCSADTVQRWFKEISQNAKTRHVHPHMLRHTFSVQFLDRGGKIRVLQKMLGHSSLAITEKYLDYIFEDVQENYIKIMSSKSPSPRLERVPAEANANEE